MIEESLKINIKETKTGGRNMMLYVNSYRQKQRTIDIISNWYTA